MHIQLKGCLVVVFWYFSYLHLSTSVTKQYNLVPTKEAGWDFSENSESLVLKAVYFWQLRTTISAPGIWSLGAWQSLANGDGR